MNTAPAYTITNETISVIVNGKSHSVRKGSPNFLQLRDAIVKEEWSRIPNLLTPSKHISEWAKGKFSVSGDSIFFEGKALPAELAKRIREMAAGNEDPTRLFKFWERLQKNPSMRSVEQLWPFLAHEGIPLTPGGKFLAYKGVRDDYKDQHSNTFDNSPGQVHEMPRNQISDDPKQACHVGFHVGALQYAKTFSQRVVICEVDPADVVCIPYDHSYQKMRVSKYKVVGNWNGELMPNTTIENTDLPDSFDDEEMEEHDQMVDEYTQQNQTSKKNGKNRLDSMNAKELLEESMETLRKYASKNLKIVGAYRIPGGKVQLVSAIMDTRKKK